MKKHTLRRLSLLLSILMLAAMLTACDSDRPAQEDADLPVEQDKQDETKQPAREEAVEQEKPADPVKPDVTLPNIESVLPTQEPVPAESYEQICAILTTVQENTAQIYSITEQVAVPEEERLHPAVQQYGDPDYSAAELPTSGVETGNMAVSDGQRIYMVSTGELVIVSAAGAETAELGRTFAANPVPEGYGGSEIPQAVYVDGSNVYVITYEYLYKNYETSSGELGYESTERTHVKRFDVSDPSQPIIMSDYAQSGRYLTSYLSEGLLHVISAYSVWMPEESDPASYIPVLTQNGEDALMEPADILLSSGLDSTDYTVISAVDTESGAFLDAAAITGYHAWSEADGNSLYLAGTSYSFGLSEPYEEAQYLVTDFSYQPYTRLAAFSMDGNLELTASGTVEGYLYGDGSMTLQENGLYLATACSGVSYRIFVDETYGFVNYLMGEQTDTNAVYLLDSNLNVQRSLQDAAGGQPVYSIRFTGHDGYVIGYETMAPVCHMDMQSDPLIVETANAQEDFSHHLYHFGEGLTAGIGVSAGGMLQLKIYDDTMSLLASDEVTSEWSTAMNLPTAVQVFPEYQLIAIPDATGYLVYTFSGTELSAQGRVELGYVSGDTRVFDLDGLLYFCNDATVVAVDPADMSELAKTEFAYG